MLYKKEGPYLHGVLKRVEPKSDTFSVFDCHQVFMQSFAVYKASPMCYLTESPWWSHLVGLIHHFTDDKNKVQGGESTCPNSLPTTNTHIFTKPGGVRSLWTQGQKYLQSRDRKFLPWPDSQPTQLGSVWFCAQLTAFGFEEAWLMALGPLKGEWGGVLGRTAARPGFCSFSKHLLDNYYVHNSTKSLGYSGEWDRAPPQTEGLILGVWQVNIYKHCVTESLRREAWSALGTHRRAIYSGLGRIWEGFPGELMPELILEGT